jgi:hypothetical protein
MKKNFLFNLIDSPRDLDNQTIDFYTKEFTHISIKATGGEDFIHYTPAVEGWTKYYLEKGNRPQDYDRLIVVQDEWGNVIHFTGLTLFDYKEKKIIWVHITISDPAYHGNILLKRAWFYLFDLNWIKKMNNEVVIMFRTPNPLVYYSMRRFIIIIEKTNSTVKCDFYPKIDEQGMMDEIPEEIKDFGYDLSKLISPDSEFIKDKFIIKGYYKNYGALYENHDFKIKNTELQDKFRNELDDTNEDGIFVLIKIKSNELY